MMFKVTVILLLHSSAFAMLNEANKQPSVVFENFLGKQNVNTPTKRQFLSTADFLDASINSINAFNSLLRKEAYRIKITSLNNPTSSDMGFNLENEVQTALRPLLEKAKITNTQKFSSSVSSIISTQSKSGVGKSLSLVSPVFPTLLSLVGNLTIQEKKITREDLDSFINTTSKYFVQYEKLNNANTVLDQNIDRLTARMRDLQFDLKEYMLDMVGIIYKSTERSGLKYLSSEELFLKYLDRQVLEAKWEQDTTLRITVHYPSDGIKGAKDLANNLQKLFNDYQKVYTENYSEIKTILGDAKKLGRNVNVQQVDASVKEIDELYNESKTSDILSLRLTTLFERLKALAATEQAIASGVVK